MSDSQWNAPGEAGGTRPEVPPVSPQQPPPIGYGPPPPPDRASGPGQSFGPGQTFDPGQNWGMAVPSGVGYAVLVPRPPRPAAVGVAITLAYAGVVLALVFQLANATYEWTNRDRIFGSGLAGTPPPGLDTKHLIDTSALVGLLVGGVLWLLVAVGVVVCTVLTNRKKNAARIVLASAMGVMGLYDLCSAGATAAMGSMGRLQRQSGSSSFTFAAAAGQVTWWQITAQALLAVIALIVFVCLIVPPSNRYFAAGAGRRYIPED